MHARDQRIDLLRGLAIVVMIYANLLPLTNQSYTLATQLVSSLAAPVFVLLSGMMVVLSADKHSFGYCVKRASMIFVIACLVDIVCWQTVPLFSFDILYFIALSLPLATLVERHCSRTGILCLIALCLSSSQYLLASAGYQPTSLIGDPSHWPTAITLCDKAVRLIFIDGDFPLLNWFAFSLAGLLLGRWYFHRSKASTLSVIRVRHLSLGLIVIGAMLWALFPGAMVAKEGYAELFYPLVPGCFLFSLGVFTLMLITPSQLKQASPHSPLVVLGQHALFCYTLHLLIIGVAFDRLFSGAIAGGTYLLLLALLYTTVIVSSRLLDTHKHRFSSKTPHIVRLWLGV